MDGIDRVSGGQVQAAPAERGAAAATRPDPTFLDAWFGRLAVPGQIASRLPPAGAVGTTVMADHPIAARYDVSAMTADDVISLARELEGAGRLSALDSRLLSFGSFGSGGLFSPMTGAAGASPLAALYQGFFSTGRGDRTADMMAEYASELEWLKTNGGSAEAIQGTRNVLTQLRMLATERAMFGAADGGRDRDRSFGGGAAGGLMGLAGAGLPISAEMLLAMNGF